jgi:hypothetical protein
MPQLNFGLDSLRLINFLSRLVHTVVRFLTGLSSDYFPKVGGQEVSAAARFSGIESRRSTRIDRTVPLVVVGQTKLGLSFQERTSAVSLNLHGCRYPSRHDYAVGSWIGLQVLEPNGENAAPVMRAQVRSIHPPMSPRELYQIGVELEAPANVWGVPSPPEDWLRHLGIDTSRAHDAAAPAPAPEQQSHPAEASVAAPAPIKSMPPAGPEYRSTGVTSFPAPPAVAAAPKSERVVITSDQLVAAVQGKLQAAAEKAVQTAINSHLTDAVRQSLNKMDEVCKTSINQSEQHSQERLEVMMRTTREEMMSSMEARLAEDRSRLEEMQESFNARTAEFSQRLESLANETQRSLTDTQGVLSRVGSDVEPRILDRLNQSIARAADDFEAAATRVSDRQLVRLMEDKQMVTREAAAQLQAYSADIRAQLQTNAHSTMEEFKRQTEVQVDLIISEATQRVMSQLAALDAENRSAIEARRRSIEGDIAHATEQSTEQFRTGMKAFLYSCLVAAVGAVDEHAKTTLDGLKDPAKALREGTISTEVAAAGMPSNTGENSNGQD